MFCDAPYSAPAARDQQWVCEVCKLRGHRKLVNCQAMRAHVAGHMIQGHVSRSACGFCGMMDCVPVLYKPRKGRHVVEQVEDISCTRYFNKFNFASATKNVEQAKKCTNTPMYCPACKAKTTTLWRYAMEEHFEQKHPGADVPSKCIVHPLELAAMGKMRLP